MAESNTFIYVTWQVVSLIGLMALFGYIKQIKIGSPILWSIFLAVDLSLFFGSAIYSHMEAIESHGELGQAISIRVELGVILSLTVLLLPYWFGIYIYAFKSKSIWK